MNGEEGNEAKMKRTVGVSEKEKDDKALPTESLFLLH